jgi:hypothetical protein
MCKWNAADLLQRIDAGQFDRNLPEFLKTLSAEELSELCDLMAHRQEKEDDPSGRQAAARLGD